jgi:hypothetical protein
MQETTSLNRDNHRRFWSLECGDSPVIGTAIHDGHGARQDVLPFMALSGDDRLREEDPFTAEMISGFTNRIVVHRSRFEVDLNRAKAQAIYLKPEQSWGLNVWSHQPSESVIGQSLDFHDDYYAMLEHTLTQMEKRYGKFVVLDVHSYNHRRNGANAASTPQQDAPDINIGTASMDRDRWADVVDATIRHFASATIGGRKLDVEENIAFQGRGEQTRFIHERFAENGCAIAIEFKKIFMDEWTDQPDTQMIADIRNAMTSLETVLEGLLRVRK